MSKTNQYLVGLLTKEILSYGKNQIKPDNQKLLSTFINIFFSHAAYRDLCERPLPDLFGMAFHHWKLIQQRRPNEVKVHVFNTNINQDGWGSKHTIIAILCQDMPFLVDSVRMKISQMGLTAHLTIHTGGMIVSRNNKHRLTAIDYYHGDGNDTLVEAPILFEVDHQSDSEVLKDIQDSIKKVIHDVKMTVQD